MDHINGRKRKYALFKSFISFPMFGVTFADQRNLGMSMKIERSTVDQVKARFSQNKKKIDEKKKDYDLEERVAELKEEVLSVNTETHFEG